MVVFCYCCKHHSAFRTPTVPNNCHHDHFFLHQDLFTQTSISLAQIAADQSVMVIVMVMVMVMVIVMVMVMVIIIIMSRSI